MGLFSRHKPHPQPSADARVAIGEFWRWWASVSDELAAAIPDGRLQQYIEVLAQRVHSIDPGLAWEFGPGRTSEHRLTVTAEGNPALRRVARRWLHAAPPADPTWTFSDLRQAGHVDSVLSIGGVELALGDLRFLGTPDDNGLDVVVFHPTFPALPEQLRNQVAFIGLDAALGEETVELWIGTIGCVLEDPPGSRPLAELRGVVDEVIAAATDDGTMGWSVLQGSGPAGPVLVMRLNRLSSIQAPHHDRHAAVLVPFTDLTPDGWPGRRSLDALHGFENHLRDIVRGSGQLVAVETCAGVRTMHFYLDSATPAVAQLEAAISGWPQGRVIVESDLDPSWEAVRVFGG